ncbi:MAG: carboxypeptidase regulatory-like domain-containing protein [Thermoanaerobaculia bacterium]|nr:MAG: carboxypeptidase regulatory-like domain-containing protein [Thermoanaerobaculia bacterium]
MGGSTQNRRSFRGTRLLLLGALLGTPALAYGEAPVGVAGRVLAGSSPVAQATVYAYQVVERSLRRALTDGGGEFAFATLPAGVYKIIAHKSGFAPAVTVLTRRSAEESQFLQVELPAIDAAGAEVGYWELRAEVPGDVLREIQTPLGEEVISLVANPAAGFAPAGFQTEVAATTGVGQVRGDAPGQMLDGQLGLRGKLGRVGLAVDGHFRTLAAGDTSTAEPSLAGEAAALRLRLDGPAVGRFDLAAESHRMVATAGGGEMPVDFERIFLRYHRELGDDGSTSVLAQYVDENGLYAGRRVHPLDLPLSSRALRLEGTYRRDVGQTGRMRSGLRYRESLRDYATGWALPEQDSVLDRSIDAWSYADWEFAPTWVMQYGMYSTARDGSVSLAPRAGLLVRFRPDWEASVSASQRVSLADVETPRGEFVPAVLGAAFGCADAEESCYELQMLHGQGEGENVRVGSSWRQFDRTVRVFLREDLFAAGEGFFMVPGDQLPEIHASIRRELGEHVVASFTSAYAAGGGGAFRAANLRLYRNDVAYLTTALDATIKPTSTGIYLAFYRVEQSLDQLHRGRLRPASAAELERIELAVSQDVARLFGMTSDWAVRVGLELLRGATLFETLPVDPDQLRHRVTTGVAVRF